MRQYRFTHCHFISVAEFYHNEKICRLQIYIHNIYPRFTLFIFCSFRVYFFFMILYLFRPGMKKLKSHARRRRNFVESETWTLTNFGIAFYFSKVTFAFSRYNLLLFHQVCNLRLLLTYIRSMHWYQYLSIEEINLTLNSRTDLKTKWPLILWLW